MKARVLEPKALSCTFDKNITLSVSMIVKNEEKMLDACLKGVKPLLDAVPSELVIIDTGSTDKTVEIAKQYTDKIYHFDWINDFGAARNFGLSKCSGQWFMFLDADDHFVDVGEMIEFFNDENQHKNYHTAYYITHNYTDMSYTDYFKFYVQRIARRTDDLHFEGAIHESFMPIYTPSKYFNSYAKHYGYAFETEEIKDKKRKRNLDLLELELEKNPDSLRTIHHYLQMITSYNDFERELVLKAVDIAEKGDDPIIFTAYFNAFVMFVKEKQSEKAVEVLNKAIKKASPNNGILTEIYARRGVMLLDLGKFKEAEESIKKYLEYYEKHDSLDKSVFGFVTSSFITPEKHAELKNSLVYCLARQNRAEEALSLYKDSEAVFIALRDNIDLSDKIKEMNYEDILLHLSLVSRYRKDLAAVALNYKNKDFYFSSIKNLLFGTLLFESALNSAKNLPDPERARIYKTYSEFSSLYIANTYNPDLLNENDIGVLPETHRFGFYMGLAQKALDSGDKLGYVKELKKALTSCNAMQEAVKFLLDEFSAQL